MFLEPISIILITLPLVLPLLEALDISLIHYAIVVTVNMELAMLTPPVGLNLYVLSRISKAPVSEVIRAVTPFVVLLFRSEEHTSALQSLMHTSYAVFCLQKKIN